MRTRWLLALVAVVAIVATACTGGDENDSTQGKVTLDYWGAAENMGAFDDQVISAFEAKYPNIDINLTTYPESNYGTKLQTALAAGVEPDLALFPGIDMMRAGQVLPLDDMIKEQNIDLSTYSQAVVGTSAQETNTEFSCSYGGKVYCLGTYVGSVQLLYNKDMFDAAGIAAPPPWPPMTVDQFIDDACRLTDKSKGIYGAAYAERFLPWESLLGSDGHTVDVTDPVTVQAYDALGRGFTDGCAPSVNAVDPWAQGLDLFIQGKLAMVLTGFQDTAKIEKAGINYGFTAIPTPPGVDPYFDVWSDGVGVMAGSDHPDEAKLFVAFLTTEGQRIRAKEGNVPISSAVAEETNWAQGVPGRE